MALTTAKQIIEARTFLRGKYHRRNAAYGTLRRLYNADYWSQKPQIQGIKLVYNLIANIVDRFTDFMSQPPDWRVIPADMSDEAIDIADKQEKLLYSQWELNNILISQQWQANLQALLGFIGYEVIPNFNEKGELRSKEKYVRINVLSPEFIFPMPKSDNIRDLDFVIIDAYDYSAQRELFSPELRQDQRRDLTNVIKYYDENKIIVMRDDAIINQIDHGWGFIPAIFGQNRVKPHFIEGIGDLDQSVGLNEYLNELISWQADILEYAANPVTIIKGAGQDVKLPVGPGAQWHLPQDGNASFLSWPGNPPAVENMINRVVQAIQDTSSLSDPAFGREVPSGTSGTAVKSLLSGIQAAMLRKQVGLGDVYVQVNEVIFKIIERMFGGREIQVRGTRKGNVFATSFKGREINGNYRNQAIWPPGVLDQPSRVDLEIQKQTAGLQSRFTTMENVGILSPKDEAERIRQEQNEDLERELIRNGNINPQAQEFQSAANQLARLQGNGGQAQPEEAQLFQIIRQTPKIRGAVFFEGKDGDKFKLVLTDMKDKATIVNRLPREFKGRITFRAFKEDQDEDLQIIIDQEEEDGQGQRQAVRPPQAANQG